MKGLRGLKGFNVREEAVKQTDFTQIRTKENILKLEEKKPHGVKK